MMDKKKPIHSFEDLEVYKLAREFSRKVGELIKTLPKEEDYNLKSQMKRAKLSVTNNVAEGFGLSLSGEYSILQTIQGFDMRTNRRFQ
jgi:hypothetical protein